MPSGSGPGSTTASRCTCASSRASSAMARGCRCCPELPRSSGGSWRGRTRSSGSSPETSKRARALGHDVTFDRMTIIGDTPLDVECARGCGAVAVAVATGQHPADELVTCEPDLLFGDLADVDRVVALLTNGGS